MSPEENFQRIDRLMEFLANQQAQLTASTQAFQERADRNFQEIEQQFKRDFERNSKQFAELGDFLARTARLLEGYALGTEQRLKEHDERLKEQEKRTKALDESLRDLAQAGKRTDERLDVLINVVERYFSNGRHQ